jgi:CheY-like chemotaxis protein
MDQDTYNWISRRAHEIWQKEGCPNGRDREHWSQAVAEMEEFARGVGAASSVDANGQVEKVLVVDDEPLIRYATVDALEQAGFEVLEAGNADEALMLLQYNDVDVVFTDVNMPGSTDGLGLVTRVRARSPKTRVIVTSGHVRLGSFDLASGVSFIPKPYAYDTLVNILRKSA